MTIDEVIKEIKRWTGILLSSGSQCSCETAEAQDMAIKALEEVQQYRAIGTPEECLRNKDFLDFLSDQMNPNDFEIYLRLYNALEEKE